MNVQNNKALLSLQGRDEVNLGKGRYVLLFFDKCVLIIKEEEKHF